VAQLFSLGHMTTLMSFTFLKRWIGLLSILSMIVLISSYPLLADGTNQTNDYIDKSIKTDVQDALRVYKQMSGLELVIDSRAAKIHTPIAFSQAYSAMYRPIDATRYLEKILLERAGIVITHLDDKRVSVTYNDALPVNKVTK